MGKLLPKKEAEAYALGAETVGVADVADTCAVRRQYLVFIRHYVDKWSAERISKESGYTVSTVYTIIRDLTKALTTCKNDPFFQGRHPGRKEIDREGEIAELVVKLRKQYLSVPEIRAQLDSQDLSVSEKTISNILKDHGFPRLPRRADDVHAEVLQAQEEKLIPASKSERLTFLTDTRFYSESIGLLCFLPIIKHYGIDRAISRSQYPKTSKIGRLSSILCFLALKLTNGGRFSQDDSWCMDRGMGLFAGLNVLPKTAWFSGYSASIMRQTNLDFLKDLQRIWDQAGVLSDTANLDFTAIPYWGDDDHLENNWSGKRSKALASLQAVLAQDPDNGIICYGDTTIRHKDQENVVLEFLDFRHDDPKVNQKVKYLVFDSKFTTYGNLGKINRRGFKFITIQRKSKGLEAKIAEIPESKWKNLQIAKANNKHRTVCVSEDKVTLKQYGGGEVRQLFIKRGDGSKPAIIITNDFESNAQFIVQKYAQRWLVETEISEQIHFFHLNRNSSGIVVKVDFDLTMTILAHNLYRLLASHMESYSRCEARTIYNKFIDNAGEVTWEKEGGITVTLKRKRHLPLLQEALLPYSDLTYSWLGDKTLSIEVGTSS